MIIIKVRKLEVSPYPHVRILLPELIGGIQKLGRSLAMPTQEDGTLRKSVGEFV